MTTNIEKRPAAHAVFGTTELLEVILLQVSNRDLQICAQRVCKTWNQAIQSSIHIQHKLFYRQTKTGNPAACSLNPLLGMILAVIHAKGHIYPHFKTNTTSVVSVGPGQHECRNRLPQKPPGLESWSWEDMYPSSEPRPVHVRGMRGYLQGQKTRLAFVMDDIDFVARIEREHGAGNNGSWAGNLRIAG